MAFEFVAEGNREIYAEWHVPLLEALFGDSTDLHHDLYELTHSTAGNTTTVSTRGHAQPGPAHHTARRSGGLSPRR